VFVIAGIQDVHIISEEIINSGLGLCLPPHMNANQVQIEDMPMKQHADDGDREQQQPVIFCNGTHELIKALGHALYPAKKKQAQHAFY
jgi:hypothetical protein